MIGYARSAFLSLVLASVTAVSPAFCQAPAAAAKPGDHASAYYSFAMAHLYAELAGAYGNRGEYVNKAIDMYKEAMKLDPHRATSAKSWPISTCRPRSWSAPASLPTN